MLNNTYNTITQNIYVNQNKNQNKFLSFIKSFSNPKASSMKQEKTHFFL